MEEFHSLWLAWHVGTFNDHLDSSLDQLHGIDFVQFVLSSTWKSNVALLYNFPRSHLIEVFGIRILLDVFLDSASLDILQVKDELEFLIIDTIHIKNHTIRVRHSDNPSSKMVNLLTGILGNIS